MRTTLLGFFMLSVGLAPGLSTWAQSDAELAAKATIHLCGAARGPKPEPALQLNTRSQTSSLSPAIREQDLWHDPFVDPKPDPLMAGPRIEIHF